MVLLAGGAGWIYRLSLRPARTPVSKPLFRGVHYDRRVYDAPRPIVVHIVTLKLNTPGLQLTVTSGNAEQDRPFSAQSTSEFLSRTGTQIAVNGSFFEPFYIHSPWDYYPRRGDPVDALGLVVTNGEAMAADAPALAALCIGSEGARIVAPPYGDDVHTSLPGDPVLVRNGVIGERVTMWNHDLGPRTAVGVSVDGNTVWLVAVDGRQPRYSEGMTLAELAAVFVDLHADAALNLDGGGSTTLVMESERGPKLLNAPIHGRVPMRERPVATHLGVYADAL